MPTLEDNYQKLLGDILEPAAQRLAPMLSELVRHLPRIDRVSARAKTVGRFLDKAAKKAENGSPKYTDPLGQIQDMIGARIVVFYSADLEAVSSTVMKYFRHIEVRDVAPEAESEFSYFGKHLILALPRDVLPALVAPENAPAFFELQIKTLFQHAWSEANHDLGYKPTSDLTSDQKRRLAFSAAQAWGADRVFKELYEELHHAPR
jgi:GTP pyrophosphokinase